MKTEIILECQNGQKQQKDDDPGSDEIEYVQADLNRGGFTPHFAEDVFNNRYGDCKDQSILLLSLLKCIDVEGARAGHKGGSSCRWRRGDRKTAHSERSMYRGG